MHVDSSAGDKRTNGGLQPCQCRCPSGRKIHGRLKGKGRWDVVPRASLPLVFVVPTPKAVCSGS